MSNRMKWMGRVTLLVVLATAPAQASWWNLIAEDFGPSATNRWTYAGVSNALNQALFRLDATSGVVRAEWDQTNSINGDYVVPPTIIRNSYLSAPLARSLTDRHTFRLHATLFLETNSIPNTTEFWQLANIGLYDLQNGGSDRALTAPLIKDTSNAVEFNYFIGNAYAGPSVSGLIASDIAGLDFQWTIGPSAAMGTDFWLPTDTPLYLELTYYGAATGTLARKLRTAIYTDSMRANLLVVNGQPLEELTSALPQGQSFSVKEVAVVNYAAPNFGDVIGVGRGAYDDISVDIEIPEASLADSTLVAGSLALTLASSPGASYAIMSTEDVMNGPWQTQSVVVAGADFVGYTNALNGPVKMFRVEKLSDP